MRAYQRKELAFLRCLDSTSFRLRKRRAVKIPDGKIVVLEQNPRTVCADFVPLGRFDFILAFAAVPLFTGQTERRAGTRFERLHRSRHRFMEFVAMVEPG